MPLLQRGELLQRERVDLAEHRPAPARPARSRFCCSSRTYGTGSGVRVRVGLRPRAARRSSTGGTRLSGPYSATSASASRPSSSSARSSSCSMRIRCWVRAISSRCTVLTSSSCSLARSRSRARTASSSSSRPRRACSTAVRSVGGRGDRHLQPARGRPRRRGATASATRPSRSSRSRRAAARARASRSARAASSSESARPCSARARSSAVRRASRASISACAAGPGRLGEPLARRRCPAPRRGRPRPRRAAARARPARRGPCRGPPRPRRWPRSTPLGLALGGPGQRAELAELLGHRGQGRVGLVQLGQRDVDAVLGLEPLLLEPGRGRSRAARTRGWPRRAARWPRRPRPAPRSGWAATEEPPDGEVRAEQVALAGDRGDVGQVGDQPPGGVEVVDDGDLEQQPGQRGPQRRRGTRPRRRRS